LPTQVIVVPDAALASGFANAFTGASTSRTLMLPELRDLLAALPADAAPAEYRDAVVARNALAKPTADSRAKTVRFLRDRFALNPAVPVFHSLRALWEADPAAQPLLALLAASARDPLLRGTAPAILSCPEGAAVAWPMLAEAMEVAFPARFSGETVPATAQRLAASFTQAGHLAGRAKKIRARAECRPTAVAYALLLGHLCGAAGDALFQTLWADLLDAPPHVVREQAAQASRLGWIDYKHAGAVTEVGFRHLLRGEG
jgi:hypothetical protein